MPKSVDFLDYYRVTLRCRRVSVRLSVTSQYYQNS